MDADQDQSGGMTGCLGGQITERWSSQARDQAFGGRKAIYSRFFAWSQKVRWSEANIDTGCLELDV